MQRTEVIVETALLNYSFWHTYIDNGGKKLKVVRFCDLLI